ncbi:MAG: hypothetical protein GWP91_25270 [Rhodobacterales bacterium]|nr:hypothetical protein [Rhodobacterales bacterium]
MQDEPHKTALLIGVARFLEQDIRPQIADKALAFRLRIATHLLTTVVRELAFESQADAAELASLQAILGQNDTPLPDSERRAEAILAGNVQAVTALESDALSADTLHDHLERALAARLAVSNPRFDLSPEIE